MTSFEGKVAIITGAASGIGLSVALNFAKKACKLSLVDKNIDDLSTAKSKCLSCGLSENDILLFGGDITGDSFVQAVVEKTVSQLGRLDILVNSAGITNNGGLATIRLEDFDRVFDVNLKAMFRLIQLATPHLKKYKGNVVNVSSVLSTRRLPNRLVYSLTKRSVDLMTEHLALELAKDQVRVNAVSPSSTNTNIYTNNGMSIEESEAEQAACAARIPMGRIAEPEDVAKAISFLASEEADYITGVILFVSGGAHLC